MFFPKLAPSVTQSPTLHASDEVVAVSGRGSIVGKVVDIIPKIASVVWLDEGETFGILLLDIRSY